MKELQQRNTNTCVFGPAWGRGWCRTIVTEKETFTICQMTGRDCSLSQAIGKIWEKGALTLTASDNKKLSTLFKSDSSAYGNQVRTAGGQTRRKTLPYQVAREPSPKYPVRTGIKGFRTFKAKEGERTRSWGRCAHAQPIQTSSPFLVTIMLNAPGRASPAAENYAGLLSLSGYPKGSVTPLINLLPISTSLKFLWYDKSNVDLWRYSSIHYFTYHLGMQNLVQVCFRISSKHFVLAKRTSLFSSL